MSYTVVFDTVSTVGLESSPAAAAMAGLRAYEASYFKTKYNRVFTAEPAAKAKNAIAWVERILKEERDTYQHSRGAPEATMKASYETVRPAGTTEIESGSPGTADSSRLFPCYKAGIGIAIQKSARSAPRSLITFRDMGIEAATFNVALQKDCLPTQCVKQSLIAEIRDVINEIPKLHNAELEAVLRGELIPANTRSRS
jgi:hypothetical protein